MSRRDAETEAAPGSLSEHVLSGLIALKQFEDARNRATRKLFGSSTRRNHLRESLLREIMIQYGRGVSQSIAHYRKACSEQGSGSSIRLEVSKLASKGLILIQDHPTDARASKVVPTQRLVDFMALYIPSLFDELKRVTRWKRGI